MKLNKKNICFVAGKSGGHIIPCITLARKCENPFFITTDATLDQKIIEQNNITRHTTLPLGTFGALSIKKIPLLTLRMAQSFLKSIWMLLKNRPEKIVTTGGLIAIPMCVASFILRIPIELWELNAVPGKATKLLAPLASQIHVCFKTAKQFFNPKKCHEQPYPLRFTPHTQSIQKNDIKTILVLGGSQGSLFLNNAIKNWIEQRSSAASIKVIHQTGTAEKADFADFYQKIGIQAEVFPFKNNLHDRYTQADLVICRAGAGTLFETLLYQKPCIVIPLENVANSHQLRNAQAMAKEHSGLFRVLLQNEITRTPQKLARAIEQAFSDRKQWWPH